MARTILSKTATPGAIHVRTLQKRFEAVRYLAKLARGTLQFNSAGELVATDQPVVAGLIGTVQRLSGAGAVNLTTLTTALTSTGADQALTLANGVDGQIKTIVHDVDGGSAVLTPATKTGFTTVTFTNAGDTVTLQYLATRGWFIIGSRGVTIG